MKQYCRYCAFCFEADDFRCSNHPKGKEPHWTEADIKRANHCPNFSLTEDVITGREYVPRPVRRVIKVINGITEEQLTFDSIVDCTEEIISRL